MEVLQVDFSFSEHGDGIGAAEVFAVVFNFCGVTVGGWSGTSGCGLAIAFGPDTVRIGVVGGAAFGFSTVSSDSMKCPTCWMGCSDGGGNFRRVCVDEVSGLPQSWQLQAGFRRGPQRFIALAVFPSPRSHARSLSLGRRKVVPQGV